MDGFQVYNDMKERTGGEIYIGEPYIMGLNPKLNQRAEDFVPFFQFQGYWRCNKRIQGKGSQSIQKLVEN